MNKKQIKKENRSQKPELLLPVGNIEAFYAAIEGGANAIYMGLSQFNARNRAKNFSVWQMQWLVEYARKRNVRSYITLNTLVKNKELPELINLLHILKEIKVDAVIIQDWGVYQIIKKYFPEIHIHGSTQGGVHNSMGTHLAAQLGFDRIILARELTIDEIKTISEKSSVELETFVHGALCYSFSGYCLFSSYLGGMSGNRGLCRQPCRRHYSVNSENRYLFSLKDLELIELIPTFASMRVSAVKIEGRMRTAEYVFRVAQAYRMVLDDYRTIPEAKELLKLDTGRLKTSYFPGKMLKDAIADNPYTGLLLGEISSLNLNNFSFITNYPIKLKDRIRIMPKDDTDTTSFKINQITFRDEIVDAAKPGQLVTLTNENAGFSIGDKIFLVGSGDIKFKNKFPTIAVKKIGKLRESEQNRILKEINHTYSSINQNKKIYTYVRIDSPEMLSFVAELVPDYLIINIESSKWDNDWFESVDLIKEKTIIELPKFIIESQLSGYQKLIFQFFKTGFNDYMLSHLSQKELLPKSNRVRIHSNENVYVMNNAALDFVKTIINGKFIHSVESDFENMFSFKTKEGIVPLYFHPHLFYSRMPVPLKSGESFTDNALSYKKISRNGFTIITSEKPVAIFQYKEKLIKQGFNKFLIDLSFTDPSKETLREIKKNYELSGIIKDTREFNFKKGLW